MIISYKHNLIFMHSCKTAGSSITVALNRSMGPRDIQVGSWKEVLESGGRMNRRAMSCAWQTPVALLKHSVKDSIKMRSLRWSPRFVNIAVKDYFRRVHEFDNDAHTSAACVQRFDPEMWENAFTFCFVRNPWSHAVSDYYWRLRTCQKKNVSFKDFLHRLDDPGLPDPQGIRPPIITNWSIYTINDSVAVNFIGRYETLQDDLEKVSQKIGLSIDLRGVRIKGSVRERSKSIQDHYDEESVELVSRIYAKEIAEFGYRPFA